MRGMAARPGAGRPPKPTALKRLTGAHIKHPERLNDREPELGPGVPKRPPWLRKDAHRAWRFYVSVLSEMGVLTKADGPMLGQLCNTEAEYVEATEPKDRAEASKRHVQYLQQFGLTPSSRAKVRVERLSAPNEFERLYNSSSRTANEW
jgi:phage terminase small subunit